VVCGAIGAAVDGRCVRGTVLMLPSRPQEWWQSGGSEERLLVVFGLC
jgi:hypothetical protein